MKMSVMIRLIFRFSYDSAHANMKSSSHSSWQVNDLFLRM